MQAFVLPKRKIPSPVRKAAVPTLALALSVSVQVFADADELLRAPSLFQIAFKKAFISVG
ncbi:thiamine monophosphate synthase [Methylocaldum marinum]|jgi:hypothetical protein|uniref:Thiamine monophosphate synthase n=1 Tax=Methylocaldum marinum TaxID=1432792 RepID=A0A250KTJ6_9GAMM|nr:thiamine monophosphate synthase [Methylocaldum marinum]BBA34937.1 thiamine monophosphate synthase [Methylocaldum marinum]